MSSKSAELEWVIGSVGLAFGVRMRFRKRLWEDQLCEDPLLWVDRYGWGQLNRAVAYWNARVIEKFRFIFRIFFNDPRNGAARLTRRKGDIVGRHTAERGRVARSPEPPSTF